MATHFHTDTSAPRSTFGLDFETQERLVEKKLAEFTWDNPLGISPYMSYAVLVYSSVLVVCGLFANCFSRWVLQSTFLKDLVVQPLLTTLLYLNSLVLVSGPLYLACVQFGRFYITGEKIFHCYLLNLLHNFSLVGSSLILLIIILERALAIGRSKQTWNRWRKACTSLGTLLLQLSLVLCLGDLFFLRADSVTPEKKYPVCVPWWENEHGSAVWFKILASAYSIGPGLLIVVFILLLEICSAKYILLRRVEQDSLTDYQALLLELSTTVHFKFVNAASALGIAFIILCSPLGLFVLLVPALQGRALGVGAFRKTFTHFPFTDETNETLSAIRSGVEIVQQSFHGNANMTPLTTATGSSLNMDDQLAGSDRLLRFWEYRYTLVSRTDTETIIWFMRYTFCGAVVPILLGTEVLFAREWKGRLRQLMNVLCFWRSSNKATWPGCICSTDKQAPGFTPTDQQSPHNALDLGDPNEPPQTEPVIAGPYIARLVGQSTGVDSASGRVTGKAGMGPARAIRPEKSIKDKIQVFDASKPARAGRRVDKLLMQFNPKDDFTHAVSLPRQGDDIANQETQITGRAAGQGPVTPSHTWHAYIGTAPVDPTRGQISTSPPAAPPRTGVWSTTALPRQALGIVGKASTLTRPGVNFGKNQRQSIATATTTMADQVGTSAAPGPMERPHPGAPLVWNKIASGIPVMTLPTHIWDYHLLAQLAAEDNYRRRNFVSCDNDDGAVDNALASHLVSRSLPGLSITADSVLHTSSRSLPQQQQPQQRQVKQARPSGILKPHSTGNTPRATRREQEQKERGERGKEREERGEREGRERERREREGEREGI